MFYAINFTVENEIFFKEGILFITFNLLLKNVTQVSSVHATKNTVVKPVMIVTGLVFVSICFLQTLGEPIRASRSTEYR